MSDIRSIIEHALSELATHVTQDDQHLVLPGDAILVANHVATALEESGVLAPQELDPNIMQLDATITKPTVTANVKGSFSVSDALRVLFTDPGKPQQ